MVRNPELESSHASGPVILFGKRKKESPHKIAARKIVEAERLRRIGDLELSEAACREALEIDPENRAGAFTALGAVLNDQGRLDDSVTAYEHSLGEQADQPLVFVALAAMCLARGAADEALLLAEKACELAPGLTTAKIARANMLEQLGRGEEAFAELNLAFRLAPRDADNARALATFVARRGFAEDTLLQSAWQDCEAAVLGAFHAGGMNGRRLAAAAGNILCAKYAFSAPGAETDGALREQLSQDELFIRLLQECVNSNPVIEIFCAQLRRQILLQNCARDELPTPAARLAAALALQNQNNGYVIWTDGEEEKTLAGEEQRLRAGLQADDVSIAGATRAALQLYAMYRPLAQHGDAGAMLDLPLGGEAGRLVLLTIREARELAAEAARVASFTNADPAPAAAPDDGVILPWAHFEAPGPASLMAYLRRHFPGFSPQRWSAGSCDILVPGCGSGEQAVGLAVRFPASRICAIDRQVSALGYGARRALKLGLGNIEFAAGDAMSAGAGERRFHFIDGRDAASGLSATPAALIGVLAGLLVPGGLLRLDVAGKEHAENIRTAFEIGARRAKGSLQFARRDIAFSAGDACTYLRRQEGYYDLSNCLGLIATAERGGGGADDLLAAISSGGLKLIGQFAPADLRVGYRHFCPEDPLLTNLTIYETYMRHHPGQSGGMFRLLLQKSE